MAKDKNSLKNKAQITFFSAGINNGEWMSKPASSVAISSAAEHADLDLKAPEAPTAKTPTLKEIFKAAPRSMSAAKLAEETLESEAPSPHRRGFGRGL